MATKKRQRKSSAESDLATSTRPFWSGTISFGLVSIPVDLFPANRGSSSPGLRMLGPEGHPLRREYQPEKGGRALGDEDIVRGFEYAKGKFVLISDEELERLAPEKTRDIDLKRFVPAKDVDPLYFENSYFLAPSGKSSKAHELLARSMEDSERAGIATFVMRGKEYLVAIFSENGILRAETLRFGDELRSPKDIGLPKKPKIPATKIKAFERLIAKSTKRQLSPKLLEDEHAEELRKLAERKHRKGEDVVEVEATDEEGGGQVIDLMAVLTKSLKRSEPARGKKKRAA